jgi:haloalkane dehalogenase
MKDIAFREKELKKWTELFPQAKVVKYPNVGHFVAEEDPDKLIHEMLDLLKE